MGNTVLRIRLSRFAARAALIAPLLASCASDKRAVATDEPPRGRPVTPAAAALAIPAASPTPSPAPAPKPPATPPGGTMQIEYTDMPDDSWRKAAEVAGEKWKTAFPDKTARIVIRPLKSPDGAIVPYQLQGQTFNADGSSDWIGATLVWNGEVLSGKGRDAAVKYLRGVGFPGTHMPLGHLIEALDLTDAVPSGWLRAPVPWGWNAVTDKVPLIGEPPATLEYGKSITTLMLYRGGAIGSGGGHTRPPTERLTIRFKADASMTLDAARRTSGSTTWEPFTP